MAVFSQRKREKEREWADGWIRGERVTAQDRSRINDACTRIPWTCAGVRGNRRLSRCLTRLPSRCLDSRPLWHGTRRLANARAKSFTFPDTSSALTGIPEAFSFFSLEGFPCRSIISCEFLDNSSFLFSLFFFFSCLYVEKESVISSEREAWVIAKYTNERRRSKIKDGWWIWKKNDFDWIIEKLD